LDEFYCIVLGSVHRLKNLNGVAVAELSAVRHASLKQEQFIALCIGYTMVWSERVYTTSDYGTTQC